MKIAGVVFVHEGFFAKHPYFYPQNGILVYFMTIVFLKFTDVFTTIGLLFFLSWLIIIVIYYAVPFVLFVHHFIQRD